MTRGRFKLEDPRAENDWWEPCVRPSGEAKLWAAVLQQAYKDAIRVDLWGQYKNCKPEARRVMMRNIKETAIGWFLSPSEGIGSFLWICCVLDLDEEYWRAPVLKHYDELKEKIHRISWTGRQHRRDGNGKESPLEVEGAGKVVG